MKILARCYDRVIVALDDHAIAEVELRDPLRAEGQRLIGTPTKPKRVRVSFDTGDMKAHACDRCRDNFGPRGYPAEDAHAFQQFALQHGAYPWSGNQPGWYCMGCSMPPR